MKRELLIKELRDIRDAAIETGYGNGEFNLSGFNLGSGLHSSFNSVMNFIENNEYDYSDITLAEFLGWEEGVEYKYDCDRFKIMDNELFIYNRFAAEKWLDAYDVSINRFEVLRNAKKVKERYIVPLPNLKTSDGEQQYLTHADNTFFASRRDKDLRQTWKEEHLKYIPEEYRKYAVELKEVG